MKPESKYASAKYWTNELLTWLRLVEGKDAIFSITGDLNYAGTPQTKCGHADGLSKYFVSFQEFLVPRAKKGGAASFGGRFEEAAAAAGTLGRHHRPPARPPRHLQTYLFCTLYEHTLALQGGRQGQEELMFDGDTCLPIGRAVFGEGCGASGGGRCGEAAARREDERRPTRPPHQDTSEPSCYLSSTIIFASVCTLTLPHTIFLALLNDYWIIIKYIWVFTSTIKL